MTAADGNNKGGGFAVLMSPTSSPSTVRLLKMLQDRLPNALGVLLSATICGENRFDAAATGAEKRTVAIDHGSLDVRGTKIDG